MPRKINLLGQRFNKLLVKEETNQRDRRGSVVWLCQCDCGNTTFASTNDLRTGHKQSCGCLNKEKAAILGKSNLKDLVGQKFGLLTVIAKDKTEKTLNGSTKIYWKCKCDCGNELIVRGNSLQSGNTKSCGCIKSFGEQRILQILQENQLRVEREKTFPDTSFRFDFFVENKYIIEYDGKQHFQDYCWGSEEYHSMKESQQRDLEKNKYCHNHKLPIIRIPYTHYVDLELKDLLLETSDFVVKEFLDEQDSEKASEVELAQTEGIEQVPEPYRAAAINWDYETQRCDKCVHYRSQCGGPCRYAPGKCPTGQSYKRDPPDGGFYG